VVVDFVPDPEVIEEARTEGHLTEPPGMLEEYWLRMPLILRLNGTDLIPRAYYLPLIWFAHRAFNEVRAIGESDELELRFVSGGSLRFARGGQRLRVDFVHPHFPASAEADFAAVVSAWHDCSQRARAYLITELPGLKDVPDLQAWFRAEE
jgi:hypothetical protein